MTYLVLDVETTSFTKTEFRIIEIALIVINAKGERLKSWHSLVNPECKVTFTKVHGLTDEDVKNAPKFINLASYIANELQNRILVGHNISYDYGVLKSEFARIGIKMPSLPRICTLQMCYDLELPLENVTLSTVRKELEIPEGLAHSALHDTAATTAVFASLLKLYELRHVNTLRAFSGPNPEMIESKDWMPQQLFENEFFIFDDVRWSAEMGGCSYKIDSEEAGWNSEKVYENGNIGHRPGVKGGYFPVPPVDSFQDMRSAMCLVLSMRSHTSRSTQSRFRRCVPRETVPRSAGVTVWP